MPFVRYNKSHCDQSVVFDLPDTDGAQDYGGICFHIFFLGGGGECKRFALIAVSFVQAAANKSNFAEIQELIDGVKV